jgi:hypothetical protein
LTRECACEITSALGHKRTFAMQKGMGQLKFTANLLVTSPRDRLSGHVRKSPFAPLRLRRRPGFPPPSAHGPRKGPLFFSAHNTHKKAFAINGCGRSVRFRCRYLRCLQPLPQYCASMRLASNGRRHSQQVSLWVTCCLGADCNRDSGRACGPRRPIGLPLLRIN